MTEKMGYRRFRTGRSWMRVGAALALVLVGLVAAVAVARAGDPRKEAESRPGVPVIAAGVTIAGVPVGGYTTSQAGSATRDAFAQKVALTTDTHIRLVSPGKLGAHPLVADAVAGALRAAPGE